MKIVGVTGGIACGKSSVCNIIRDNGYKVIDCDKMVHEMMIGLNLFTNSLIGYFGKDIYNGKEIDRKKLGNIVFNDEKENKKLIQISTPFIIEELIKKLNLIL